uniref:MARVEL domain-containing protein n=1 Tax=Anopheles epiroticus TaxID=199890 RepID=A0A182P0V9_9DIPT
MTKTFANLTPGELALAAGKPAPPEPPSHTLDVPVLGEPERPSPWQALFGATRTVMRDRLRMAQLMLTIGALALIRPQYNDAMQWTTLVVLCHTFVLSGALLWDRHCGGAIVQRHLPLLDWRLHELQYTGAATLALYALSYGVMFAHKGYGGSVACNWVSSVLTLLTALLYGGETWIQLRNQYDGRTGLGAM